MKHIPEKIKLMPDYECWCLWDMVGVGNINPELLPISDTLKKDLNAWEIEYDSTLNWDDPIESGFATEDELVAFNNEGLRLLKNLQTELKDTKFFYMDQLSRELIEGK